MKKTLALIAVILLVAHWLCAGVVVRPELNNGTKPIFGIGYRLNPYHLTNRGLQQWVIANERLKPAGVNGYPIDIVTTSKSIENISSVWATAFAGKEYGAYMSDTPSYDAPRWQHNPKTLVGTGPFTVMIYGTFYGVASTEVAFSNAAGSYQWRMQPNYNGTALSANSFCFLTYGGSFANAGADAAFTNGVPVMFVGVRSGSSVTLYKNGTVLAQASPAVQNVDSGKTNGFAWGWNSSTDYSGAWYTAKGLRIQSAFWNRALSASEIADLYINPFGTIDRPRLIYPNSIPYLAYTGGAPPSFIRFKAREFTGFPLGGPAE